ncbi:MAG: hypothetical protein DMF35_10135 [Verrucomicrobia bacterium]|nr:MAG: hypothetical protein DMF35_10135 [Verrucomicrobiota bacterium]
MAAEPLIFSIEQGTARPTMKLAKIPAPDFDLAMTLGSGQLFHWEKLGNGFIGAIGDRPVYVEQRGDSLLTSCEDEKLIRNYFALDHPLAEICASFPVDPVMGAAKEFCRGLRIVRQPKWECLATFICSYEASRPYPADLSKLARTVWGAAEDHSRTFNRKYGWWIGRSAGDGNRLGFADICWHRARDCSIHPNLYYV